MSRPKIHECEVILGDRYILQELNGVITIIRGDGKTLGKGRWQEDQIVDFSSTAIPDNVFLRLERELKTQMDNNWGED